MGSINESPSEITNNLFDDFPMRLQGLCYELADFVDSIGDFWSSNGGVLQSK